MVFVSRKTMARQNPLSLKLILKFRSFSYSYSSSFLSPQAFLCQVSLLSSSFLPRSALWTNMGYCSLSRCTLFGRNWGFQPASSELIFICHIPSHDLALSTVPQVPAIVLLCLIKNCASLFPSSARKVKCRPDSTSLKHMKPS